MTARKTAFFIPHGLELPLNTTSLKHFADLRPRNGACGVFNAGFGVVAPVALVAVAVLLDLQSLHWVYVQLLKPWVLGADVYFGFLGAGRAEPPWYIEAAQCRECGAAKNVPSSNSASSSTVCFALTRKWPLI